jgi:hypothetical protein
VKRRTLAPEVRISVEPGAAVYTDALKSYLGLGGAYDHQTIDQERGGPRLKFATRPRLCSNKHDGSCEYDQAAARDLSG